MFPFATAQDVQVADAAARKVKRPPSIPKDPVDTMSFPTPKPQPGGQAREYWIQAAAAALGPRADRPRRVDEDADPVAAQVHARSATSSTAPASPPRSAPPTMPGPTLAGRGRRHAASSTSATATTHFGQAHTMHPHGVSYTPDYDGAYLGTFTRVGGFIAPGEEFTYTWECVPELGRRLAVPRPRAQPHDQRGPRPVRRDRSSARRARRRRTSRQVLVPAPLPPQITGLAERLRVRQRPRVRRQHADGPRQGRRQDVALHVFGGDAHVPHLPRPRPPLAERRRRARGQPDARPARGDLRPLDARTTRAAGFTTVTCSATRTPEWPVGTWSNHELGGKPNMRVLAYCSESRRWPSPHPAVAATYPPPANPPGVQRRRRARSTRCKVGKGAEVHDDPGRGEGREGRRHDPRGERHLQRQVAIARSRPSATSQIDRQRQAPGEGHRSSARASTARRRRTASTSTAPTRSRSRASPPSTTRATASSCVNVDGYKLDQHRASSGRHLRPLRVQLLRRRDDATTWARGTTTPASTSGRRRSRPSRRARSSRT